MRQRYDMRILNLNLTHNLNPGPSRSAGIKIKMKSKIKRRALSLSILLLPLLVFAQDKHNFLIIIVDDQGYADLSAYEHSAPDVQTPQMDRLASRGVLFTNAYATAGVCSPSRAGWNSGQHQARWIPRAVSTAACPRTSRTSPVS